MDDNQPSMPLINITEEEMIKLLNDGKIDVNILDDRKSSLLHLCCGKGWVEASKVLILKYKADVNIKDECGNTPLHRISPHSPKELIDLLLSNGADINDINDFVNTPLHVACDEIEYNDLALYLLDRGALINIVNEAYYSPLLYACINNNIKLINLLLDKGANINIIDYINCTVLHIICSRYYRSGHKENDKIETIKVLLNRGININEKNDQNDTALDNALENGYVNIAKVLLDYGSIVDYDNEGHIIYNTSKIPLKYRYQVQMFLLEYSENTVKPAKRG
jgi:ankyrin repeat protein